MFWSDLHLARTAGDKVHASHEAKAQSTRMSLKRPRSDEEVVIGVVDIVGTVQELRGKVARLEQELRDCNGPSPMPTLVKHSRSDREVVKSLSCIVDIAKELLEAKYSSAEKVARLEQELRDSKDAQAAPLTELSEMRVAITADQRGRNGDIGECVSPTTPSSASAYSADHSAYSAYSADYSAYSADYSAYSADYSAYSAYSADCSARSTTGSYLVRVLNLPDGVASLPLPRLESYFASIPGWTVQSVQRTLRGSGVSELWVRAQLAAQVPLKGTLSGPAADGPGSAAVLARTA